jgi:DNA-binding IclR family transcriptional regulator
MFIGGANLSDSAEESGNGRDPAPALSRGIRILELLAAATAPMALRDIAVGIGAAKSSTSNLCTVLEDFGLIRRADVGYLLGPRTVEFAGAYISRFNEFREFYRYCSAAPVLSQQVVQIAMLEGTDVVYLARHDGDTPLRLTANVGDRFPAAPTAVGNALLAALPDSAIREAFDNPGAFPRRTERSVGTVSDLLAKLRLARERGYATDDGEVHPGLSGLAVRIPPRSDISPALAVGCTFLTDACSVTDRARLVTELGELRALMCNPFRSAADS